MSKMFRGAAFFFGLLSFLTLALAGSANLVSPPQPGMHWQVELLPEKDRLGWPSDTPERRPAPMAGTATHPLAEENWMGADFRKQVLHEGGKEKLVRYAYSGVILVEQAGGFVVDTQDGETRGGVLSDRRFSEFGWVRSEGRIGVMQVDGIRCDIYAAPWPDPSGALPSGALSGATEDLRRACVLAAISSVDKRPVRLETPIAIKRYRFEKSNDPASLPPGALAAFREYEKALEHAKQRYQIPQ